MLAIWAKHTKIQCASAETCDKCANVRMFFSATDNSENLACVLGDIYKRESKDQNFMLET